MTLFRHFLQVALLVSFLCVQCTHGWPKWAAFLFFELVALWFLVVVLALLLLHLFRLHGRMRCINWPLTVSPAHLASFAAMAAT